MQPELEFSLTPGQQSAFHDNPQDLAFLESSFGRQAIIGLHVRGIISYVKGDFQKIVVSL